MSKMVITDLDGTLLNPQQLVSQHDYDTLLDLGKAEILRVVATGRSPHSFLRVIPRDFPIDYLVFSSGSGIMDWKTGDILQSFSMSQEKVHELVQLFRQENISFKVLSPAPNNHKYLYYSNGDHHPDFDQRMKSYLGYETRIEFDPPNYGEASQILIILPRDVKEFERLSALCKGVKVIRATSPLDHQSIWMEIFNPMVSKGNACQYLCNYHNISTDSTVAVGNDYNDIDLLNFAAQAYIVDNAPADIKQKYSIVSSNSENGFTDAVKQSGIRI